MSLYLCLLTLICNTHLTYSNKLFSLMLLKNFIQLLGSWYSIVIYQLGSDIVIHFQLLFDVGQHGATRSVSSKPDSILDPDSIQHYLKETNSSQKRIFYWPHLYLLKPFVIHDIQYPYKQTCVHKFVITFQKIIISSHLTFYTHHISKHV